VVREREVKAKHLQLVSGMNPLAYWLSVLFWDTVSYVPTALLIYAAYFAFKVDAYTQTDCTHFVFALLLLAGPALAAFSYFFSQFFNSHSNAQVAVMLFTFITGLCLMMVSFVLTLLPQTSEMNYKLRNLYRIFPAFCFGDGLLQLALCSTVILVTADTSFSCPAVTPKGFDFINRVKPLSWENVCGDLVFLASEIVVFFLITVLWDVVDVHKASLSRCLTCYGCTTNRSISRREAADMTATDLAAASRNVPRKFRLSGGLFGGVATDGYGYDSSASASAVGVVDDDVLAEEDRVCAEIGDRGREQERGEETGTHAIRIEHLRKVYYETWSLRSLSQWIGDTVKSVLNFYRTKGPRSNDSYVSVDMKERDGSFLLSNDPTAARSHHRHYRGHIAYSKVAVHDLTFAVEKGECFGFLGVNGAGKTSVISILSGDNVPTAGDASIDGCSVIHNQATVRTKIGKIKLWLLLLICNLSNGICIILYISTFLSTV
jgi:ABC-type multidrug transport system fused ATPase/permease subunit